MKPKFPFMIYCHIEKNAGTTMHYILNENLPYYFALDSNPRYGNHRPFNEKTMQRLLNLFSPIQGIGGHTVSPHFDYQAVLPGKEIYMFAFFREPVKRYLSQLNYQIEVMKENWTFETFLNNEQFSDLQTKKIAGTADFEKAKSILTEKMSFAGLVEKFDEGLMIMKTQLGDDFDIRYKKKNSLTRNKQTYTLQGLSEIEIDSIKSKNRNDIQLYQFLKEELYPKYIELIGDKNELLFQQSDFQFRKTNIIRMKLKNQLAKFLLQPFSLKGS